MTAAPGPQQPDEMRGVQPLTRAAARFQLDPSGTTADLSAEQVRTAGQLAMWLRARDRRGCDKDETTYGLAYLLTVAFPAAPSAQPDERCACGHNSPARPVNGWPSCGVCGCTTHTPAQPVSLSHQRRHTERYSQCDDTCTADCGHCKGQGTPCTCPEGEAERLATYTCQRGTEPHAGDCPRWGTPAQPVRDTGEGRR